MSVHTHIRAVTKEISALETSPASGSDYREMVIQLLRSVVPFDAACCTTVDPRTLLSTGAVTEHSVEKFITCCLKMNTSTKISINTPAWSKLMTPPPRSVGLRMVN